MDRHAFLILAHHEPKMLQMLIDEIDDDRADIFVHIDCKTPFDGSDLTASKSRLTVLPHQIDGRWGDYSLVEIEFALLRAATDNGPYAYYHLLSGVDMMISPVSEIIEQCKREPQTEYIAIGDAESHRGIEKRCHRRWLFPRHMLSRNPLIKLSRRAWLLAQGAVGYRRYPGKVVKGSQWWSITDNFAHYALSRQDEMRHYFTATFAPDEMVFQTLCMNSRFATQLHCTDDEFEGSKRYIKWVDGQLMPLTADDLHDAQTKGRWFARKRPTL